MIPRNHLQPAHYQAALYIHIPFCQRRCDYCSFVVAASSDSTYWQHYVDALLNEMRQWSGCRIRSVFLGGGTPSLLSPDLLERCVTGIRENFSVDSSAEWSIECHPETFIGPKGYSKIQALANLGFNRVSIGIESLSPVTLGRVRRSYDDQVLQEIVRALRVSRIDNINFDLIIGWPWESWLDLRQTLKMILDLTPMHCSLYPLTIEDGTAFEGHQVSINLDAQADQYMAAHDFLLNRGWRHYEIANYCRSGFESEHNLIYWRYEDYLGLGVNAASKMGTYAFTNERSIIRYMNLAGKGVSCSTAMEELSEGELRRRRLILGLRLDEGVAFNELQKFMEEETMSRFLSAGALVRQKDRILATPRGWLISNQLFSSFRDSNSPALGSVT